MIAKRVFDFVVALVSIIISAPLFLVIAICIKLDSPGSVIYYSQRVGRYGNLFGMMRFRTVDINKPAHLSMNEKLTCVGRFIRN